jgi:hypothetical protein
MTKVLEKKLKSFSKKITALEKIKNPKRKDFKNVLSVMETAECILKDFKRELKKEIQNMK